MSSFAAGAQDFLALCVDLSLAILTIAFFLIIVRIIRGPTLPDRVVALDMLVAVAIGFIAAIGIKTQFYLYLDIAIALGLVGFLATVAFARFILNRGLAGDAAISAEIAENRKMRDRGRQ